MFVSFDSLSHNARLWVYQSPRSLSNSEQEYVLKAAQDFIAQWTAHGNNLHASLEIKYDQFLLLAVDEEIHNATGCSIDASVAFIKSLGQEMNIELFDRSQIAYKIKDEIKIVSLQNFKIKIKNGEIPENALLFNNAISLKKQLANEWLLPIADSWAGKFIPSPIT